MKRIGFIGIGNMGSALFSGFVAAGKLTPDMAYAYTPVAAELEAKHAELGIGTCSTLEEMLGKVDMILIACKPGQVLENARIIEANAPEMPVICIAAGFSLAKFQEAGVNIKVQCIMPNTPARIRY